MRDRKLSMHIMIAVALLLALVIINNLTSASCAHLKDEITFKPIMSNKTDSYIICNKDVNNILTSIGNIDHGNIVNFKVECIRNSDNSKLTIYYNEDNDTYTYSDYKQLLNTRKAVKTVINSNNSNEQAIYMAIDNK